MLLEMIWWPADLLVKDGVTIIPNTFVTLGHCAVANSAGGESRCVGQATFPWRSADDDSGSQNILNGVERSVDIQGCEAALKAGPSSVIC